MLAKAILVASLVIGTGAGVAVLHHKSPDQVYIQTVTPLATQFFDEGQQLENMRNNVAKGTQSAEWAAKETESIMQDVQEYSNELSQISVPADELGTNQDLVDSMSYFMSALNAFESMMTSPDPSSYVNQFNQYSREYSDAGNKFLQETSQK